MRRAGEALAAHCRRGVRRRMKELFVEWDLDKNGTLDQRKPPRTCISWRRGSPPQLGDRSWAAGDGVAGPAAWLLRRQPRPHRGCSPPEEERDAGGVTSYRYSHSTS